MFNKICFALLALGLLTACPGKNKGPEVWIYTSMYKDTIADIKPQLEKEFPGVSFNFYQAGSEEVAAKVGAEELAGEIKADLLISSDRFWYEELAHAKKIRIYRPKNSELLPENFKDPEGHYTIVGLPLMIMAYNDQQVPTPPKSFKDMTAPEWKGKFNSGSPLSSGTNFTTMAFLQKDYSWDYFLDLRKNDYIA